jgi:hypothetical protein
MLDEEDLLLEEHVKNVMLELMAVLWANGYKEVSVGALMRILGLDEDDAGPHNDEYVLLDEHFADVAAAMADKQKTDFCVPPGTTIH